MMHYQLEKIFSYLNEEYGDVEWGLIQAEAFSKEFAKKWVIIKPREMGFDEIKMLTNVACYSHFCKKYFIFHVSLHNPVPIVPMAPLNSFTMWLVLVSGGLTPPSSAPSFFLLQK